MPFTSDGWGFLEKSVEFLAPLSTKSFFSTFWPAKADLETAKIHPLVFNGSLLLGSTVAAVPRRIEWWIPNHVRSPSGWEGQCLKMFGDSGGTIQYVFTLLFPLKQFGLCLLITQIVFFFVKTGGGQNTISGVFVVNTTEGAHNHDSFVVFCGPVCFIPPLVVRLQIGFAL